MISDVQEKKLSHYYQILDFNGDGILERTDFIEIGKNLCTLWSFAEDTEPYNRIINKCATAWEDFKHFTGEYAETATLEEWLIFADLNIVNGDDESYEKHINGFVKDILDLFDENQDDYLSLDEYIDLFMAYRIDIKYSAKAFTKLDLNDDGLLSKQELITAFSEFFRSSDPNSRGNWIFGFWEDRERW